MSSLYVLLTGDEPFDTTSWKKQPFYEVVRQLRETDPPKPSSKIRTQRGARSGELAQRRNTDPQMLAKQVSGDLDCIIMHALEKDRERRYATPLELAADINRYLRKLPVSAHPPGIFYRTGKYVRRHRVGVGIAVFAAVMLVGFAIAQANELRMIRQQRDRADRITQFMTGIFTRFGPIEAPLKWQTGEGLGFACIAK